MVRLSQLLQQVLQQQVPATFTTVSLQAGNSSDDYGNKSASVYDVNADRVIIFYSKQGSTYGAVGCCVYPN